jgi:hypothetical protein
MFCNLVGRPYLTHPGRVRYPRKCGKLTLALRCSGVWKRRPAQCYDGASVFASATDASAKRPILDDPAIKGETVWNSSWAWSVLLIVLTVIIHVIGLGLFNVKMVRVLTEARDRPHFIYAFALGIGGVAIWATCLHAVEAGIWAAAYLLLGALPDGETAILYSLSAITTYGHSQLFLADHWRLMGALEALNGVILIGLTTTLMYGLIQRVWPVENRALPRMPWPRGENGTK